MGATAQKEGKNRMVRFEGEIALPQAAAVRKSLLNALSEADTVVLSFNAISTVDLSFLQLLCSAHRTALKMNKKISFNGELPDVVIATMKAAGYARRTGCRLDCNSHTCLWKAVTGEAHG